MITPAQQKVTHSELVTILARPDMTSIERAAIRVAMCMVLNKPIEAGEIAEALEMLINKRNKQKHHPDAKEDNLWNEDPIFGE